MCMQLCTNRFNLQQDKALLIPWWRMMSFKAREGEWKHAWCEHRNRERASSDNKAANATGVNKQLIHTPAVVYRLKNGFSFGLTGISPATVQRNLNCTKPEPAYLMIITANKMHAGLSYTRFWVTGAGITPSHFYQKWFFGYLKKSTKGTAARYFSRLFCRFIHKPYLWSLSAPSGQLNPPR